MSAVTLTHAIKARLLYQSLGAKTAAGFLRNRGYTVAQAVTMLGLPARFEA